MKQRCYQETHRSYSDYGGRGIKICPEWLADGTSEAYVSWGLANGYMPGLQIDRIDTNGNYTPDNCRFVTPKQNSRNFRHHFYVEVNGMRVLLVEALEAVNPAYTNTDLSRVYRRVTRGWPLEKSLATSKLRK